jgi:hypothetical protein
MGIVVPQQPITSAFVVFCGQSGETRGARGDTICAVAIRAVLPYNCWFTDFGGPLPFEIYPCLKAFNAV